MTTPPTNQSRVRRMDRFMAFIISGGGILIIGAVLAMLLFIMKEAVPLFLPPLARSAGTLPNQPQGALLADESGRALVLISEAGLRAIRLPEGTPLPVPAEGPATPWRSFAQAGSGGECFVVDAGGQAHLGRLAWDKPAGENDPAAWTLAPRWEPGPRLDQVPERILHFRGSEGGGLGGGSTLRVAGLLAGHLVWLEAPLDSPKASWRPVPLPSGTFPTNAAWSADGQDLFVGTQSGGLLDLDPASGDIHARAEFGEPIQSLGFALGQTSLLVGGAQGKLAAYQRIRVDDSFQLQAFHSFPSLQGPVLGFQPSQRDKRFLAWTAQDATVLHLTTERRLWSTRRTDISLGALAPRGDLVLLARGGPSPSLDLWTLEAPHPEVSLGILWGKTHYEGYAKPEYVWQSTGGSDDFEPKFSLIPLVFGTLKGTLYAMIFALPLAVLGALYTSQFATPRLRNTIKPTVEIMAALPSVVLGFLAGLVMAPLLEQIAVAVFLFPLAVLLVAATLAGAWGRLPKGFRNTVVEGREVLWALPLLVLAGWLAIEIAPWFERTLLGGSYRTWLQNTFNLAYDQRNSLVVGFAMGFAVIPIIFTISEDALSGVPKALTSASLACGASPWQTAWRVVLPTASPGIFSAAMVGLGRAIGETMIVLMATGNTPVMDWGPFNGMRTLSANIAVEIPEAPLHGTLYRVLFLAAFLLFLFTFALNTVAELVRQRLRRRYESI